MTSKLEAHKGQETERLVSPPHPRQPSPRKYTLALIALGVLQVIGISLSELLIQAHIEFKLGDEHDSGLCAASELFSFPRARAAASQPRVAFLACSPSLPDAIRLPT